MSRPTSRTLPDNVELDSDAARRDPKPETRDPSHGDTGHARSRRWILLPIALTALGLVILLGLKLYRGDQSLGEVKLQPYTAPNFDFALFNGDRFSLAQQQGKVVVVNFWASWCLPCRDEAPVLEQAWEHYRDQGVVFVGVDIKDTPEDAQRFLQRYVAGYPNGFDSQKQIYINYGVYGLPETFVVDPRGRIIHHIIGPVSQTQLDGWLTLLMGGLPNPPAPFPAEGRGRREKLEDKRAM
ncbi:MAG: TlpA family protein disulfide reductase [Dehalococcoidia bacterium]